MTFEEYAEKRKAEPILSLLIKNDDDLSKLSTDNGLRIEWIVQCTKDGTKIDRPFLEETFNNLLVEINSYFYESPDIRGFLGGFRAFLLYLPVADREHYDNRLVGYFTDIVASDYDTMRVRRLPVGGSGNERNRESVKGGTQLITSRLIDNS